MPLRCEDPSQLRPCYKYCWSSSSWSPKPPIAQAQAASVAMFSAGPTARANAAQWYPPDSDEEEAPGSSAECAAAQQRQGASFEEVRRAVLARTRLQEWREVYRGDSGALEALVRGSLVRVHPPEDHGYILLRINSVEAGQPRYQCLVPSSGLEEPETRALRLSGNDQAERHPYLFIEASDSVPTDAEVTFFLANNGATDAHDGALLRSAARRIHAPLRAAPQMEQMRAKVPRV